MNCQVDPPTTQAHIGKSITEEKTLGNNYMNDLYYFKNNELKKISSSYFQDKYLGLFFGASWCKYCTIFVENINKFKKNFPFIQIIYIPFDQTYDDYLKFLKNTDFYSLPFNNYLNICNKFNVKNLPSFIIVSPNNDILVKDGVQLIKTDSYLKNFKSLLQNHVITPKTFKFKNRFYDLFCG
ncbi:plasmoredoxin, putative [Hepatocystis sp. ex Piliocolobus tephrosceles]|nr:plasmoredoxin, putative [Hepatocystis sp. ex Piliocolobus tephrosceles]